MKNNKNNKLFFITAIAGAFAALAATTVALTKHFKKRNTVEDETIETPTVERDINELDIASINNDTPRQYVSISINGHNGGEN